MNHSKKLKVNDVVVFKDSTWIEEGTIGVITSIDYKLLIYEIEYLPSIIDLFFGFEIGKIGEL